MIPIDIPAPVLTLLAGALVGLIIGGACAIFVELITSRRRKRDGSP